MAENMIKFLRGNVASLPQTATAGAVYFTKDEGLYLGLEDGSYHRYGDFITVANVDSLPESGAHETCMYYCESENILAKWDGAKWVQINKQKTLAELGGVAKSVYEAKIALLEQADSDNASAIEGVDNRLKAAEKKLESVATTEGLGELTTRVTTAEGEIDVLQAAIAEGGSVTLAIADAKAAGTTAAGAAATAQAAADKAQGEIDALEGVVGEVAEGKTVVGLIGEAKAQADKGVSDAAAAKAAADAAAELAGTKATMAQVNEAIAGAGHAVKTEVDKAIADLETAYKTADTTLQGNIDKKADQTAVDAISGRVADIEKDYLKASDKNELLGADEALDGRIEALEGQITGLTGAMHFKGVETEMPSDLSGYVDGDVIIVGEKEYVFNKGEFVEFGDVSAEGDRIGTLEGEMDAVEGRLDALELIDHDHANKAELDKIAEGDKAKWDAAAEKAHEHANAGVLSGITAEKVAAWDSAEADAIAHADGLNTAMNTRVEALEAIDHEHANKALLDTYTQTEANLADAVAKKHEHANAAELAKIASGDVAKWNAAQANAEATAAAALSAAKTELEGKITAEANTARAAEKANADAIDLVEGRLDVLEAIDHEAYKAYADQAEADAKAYTDSALQWGSF